MFSGGNGRGQVAVVDRLGSVPLAADTRGLVHGSPVAVLEQLPDAVRAGTTSVGIAELVPRVALVFGPRIVDLSNARHAAEILESAREALDGETGDAVALVWR